MSVTKFDYELRLNRLAHRYESMAVGIEWFSNFDLENQRAILRHLAMMLLQAGANQNDVASAVKGSGLKPTFTPCVQLSKGQFDSQVSKAIQLPPNELLKTFRLFVSLLAIADQRRKADCGPNCRHWWHQDLSDKGYVQEILEKYIAGDL